MIVLLDTNIILDILLKREPFYIAAAEILRLAEKGEVKCYLTANSVTDIFYVLRKYISDVKLRETAIVKVLQLVDIVSVTKRDIYKSLELSYTDFEDALQTQCAKKLKADFLITRNVKDFKEDIVKVILPEHFLKVVKR